jgi:hypothetical protein
MGCTGTLLSSYAGFNSMQDTLHPCSLDLHCDSVMYHVNAISQLRGHLDYTLSD